MYVLQVLNSNSDYNENLAVFDDYLVTEMEAAQ
jgi:hypothetical protein